MGYSTEYLNPYYRSAQAQGNIFNYMIQRNEQETGTDHI